MINVNGGVAQVNVANDNATVHATQSNGIDVSQLENIIADIMKHMPTDITQEEQEQIRDSVEVIRAEVQSANPRKGFIKTALKGLQAINGTAQFGAAIATLVQFVGTFL